MLRAEGTTGVVVLAPEAANVFVAGVLAAPSTAPQHAIAMQQPTSAVATPCGFPMKKRLRKALSLWECGIFSPMEQGVPVTGGSASVGSAPTSSRASNQRKENYGYCQESCKEAR